MMKHELGKFVEINVDLEVPRQDICKYAFELLLLSMLANDPADDYIPTTQVINFFFISSNQY